MCPPSSTRNFIDWRMAVFDSLVELGRQLEGDPGFPPPGFYYYGKSSPIRWIVHFWPDRVHIAEVEEASLDADRPRPFSGRTSGLEAHFLVDEAAYALGVAKQTGGGNDKHASKKHKLFLNLLDTFLSNPTHYDSDLVDSVALLANILRTSLVQSDPRFCEIESKHWVSFVPETGPLASRHLFELHSARKFWISEMERRCAAHESGDSSPEIVGTCSVCANSSAKLVGKLPLKVKLVKTTPIHSLNQNAFTSFIAGSNTKDKAHLGVCFECGDTAARAFNYLSNSTEHRKPLYPSEKNEDGLSNSIALYWLKWPGPLVIESPDFEDTAVDLNDLDKIDLMAVADAREAPARLQQLRRLLDVAWKPDSAAFRLSDYAFNLAIVSPNVGRLAVRDWFSVSLEELRTHLRRYLDFTRMIEADGSAENPASVGVITEAIGTEDTNLVRSLLRTAYTGSPPAASLVILAGQRLNYLLPLEHDLRERQRMLGFDKKPVWGPRWTHALAAAISLGIRFARREEGALGTNELLEKDIGFQCGRLLALLEEAQQIYTWRQYRKRLDTSLVQHAYGGASTTPAVVFNRLMKQAAMAHLPKSTPKVREEVERANQRIAELGPIPEALTPVQQAQFGLGFFTQRAEIRSWANTDRAPDELEATETADSADGVSLSEEELS